MSDLGIKTTVKAGGGDYRWCRTKNPSDFTVSGTVDRALLTAGTHYDANGIVPSGLALGKVTATGKYGPYDPGANDGRQILAGFQLDPEQLSYDFSGVTTTGYATAILVMGAVETAFLPNTPTLNTQTPTTGQFVFTDVDYVAPAA